MARAAGNATAVALDAPSHMVGRKAIVSFLAEDFPRLFVSDVTVTFHEFHADGERVIVEETMTATLANGNHYANDYCFVFELRDELIHRVREYMDTARGHRMIFGPGSGSNGSTDDHGSSGTIHSRDRPFPTTPAPAAGTQIHRGSLATPTAADVSRA
ncbi:nuclear transport factor 2 family protein [Streptomyces sp. NPDC050263]|uniref:nuclear transport factor 2 family protein n=1 Tax=Streptomyces sp. NPDC050263 TaxID=3155037 RepID=UPI003448CA41